MSNKALAKRGLFYGFFGSIGASLFGAASGSIGIFLLAIGGFAYVVSPSNITARTTIFTKLMSLIFMPFHAMLVAFFYLTVGYLFTYSLALLTANDIALYHYVDIGLDLLSSELILPVFDFYEGLYGKSITTTLAASYVISIPFAVPSLLRGLLSRRTIVRNI